MTEVLSGTLVVADCVSNLRLSEALQRMANRGDWLPACFLAAALHRGLVSRASCLPALWCLLLLGQVWTTWFGVRKKHRRTAAILKIRLRNVALVAAVFGDSLVLPLTPWIVRNAMVFRAFIPCHDAWWIYAGAGKQPQLLSRRHTQRPGSPWNGTALEEWQKSVIGKASEAGISQTDEVAFDRFMYQQAETAIKTDPQHF